jgi:hypothetical protein
MRVALTSHQARSKWMPDGQVEVTFYLPHGAGGAGENIEGSSDLQTWKSLPGNPNWIRRDFYRLYDPLASQSDSRFYRFKSGQ